MQSPDRFTEALWRSLRQRPAAPEDGDAGGRPLPADLNPDGCGCDACRRSIPALIQMDRESIERDGWTMHYVGAGEGEHSAANIHTHGLEERLAHPDLQIVLPVKPTTAHYVFTQMVKRIREGERFQPGKCYVGLLNRNFPLEVIWSQESGRRVLRVIIPDAQGRTGPDMDPLYRIQREPAPGCTASHSSSHPPQGGKPRA